jgi:hypothetical protein
MTELMLRIMFSISSNPDEPTRSLIAMTAGFVKSNPLFTKTALTRLRRKRDFTKIAGPIIPQMDTPNKMMYIGAARTLNANTSQSPK